MEAKPLSREPVCVCCPFEFPITGEDLWMVWRRAYQGGADGDYVPVTPGEVSRRYKRFAGEDVDKVEEEVAAEKLARLKVVCLCASCYRRWIRDPADTPDMI